jgi:hypothetical protein
LRFILVENLEVFLPHISYSAALRVADYHGHQNRIRVHYDFGGVGLRWGLVRLLGEQGSGQKEGPAESSDDREEFCR